MKNLGVVLSTAFFLLSSFNSALAHADPLVDKHPKTAYDEFVVLDCPLQELFDAEHNIPYDVPNDTDQQESIISTCRTLSEKIALGEHAEKFDKHKNGGLHDKKQYFAQKNIEHYAVRGGDSAQSGSGGISLGGNNTCPPNSTIPGCGY